MWNLAALMLVVGILAGCSTEAQRMAQCEAKGISRDTCYLSEQNRQQGINDAALKQALENAKAQQKP